MNAGHNVVTAHNCESSFKLVLFRLCRRKKKFRVILSNQTEIWVKSFVYNVGDPSSFSTIIRDPLSVCFFLIDDVFEVAGAWVLLFDIFFSVMKFDVFLAILNYSTDSLKFISRSSWSSCSEAVFEALRWKVSGCRKDRVEANEKYFKDPFTLFRHSIMDYWAYGISDECKL